MIQMDTLFVRLNHPMFELKMIAAGRRKQLA